MKFVIYFLLLLCACRCSGPINSRSNPLKVLIVTDQRKFNREAFFAMFDSFENLEWTEKKHPEILDFFGTDSIRNYDAVVFYDMPQLVVPTDEQKQKMIDYFREGAPVVFLHHSIVSYLLWDEFPEIIGGRYYNKVRETDTLQSTYQHDVHYTVKIAKYHPVTEGIEDFEIFDEVYDGYFVRDDVNVLLTTDHPLSGDKIGWINQYGNSEIVFLINGHSETAYENPHYRKLVLNSINWVASNKHKARR